MAHKETRPNPVLPNLMSPDMAELGRKNLETLAAVQNEFLEARNKANRVWVAYLNEEAALTSNFTKKITTTISIPEAAVAYQQWVNQQLELLAKQAQNVLAETQDFTKACTQIMGNGKWPGTS